MAQTVMRSLRFLGLLLGLFTLPSSSLAHRLDEYLQATLVTIEPGEVRLQINLTPGVAVADQVLSRIDPDHDNEISTNEATAYVKSLQHDLTLRLDHRNLELKLVSSSFSEPAELRTGTGIIQLEFSATISRLAVGTHRLILHNRHLPGLSVYLLNATPPGANSIQIIRQKRNRTQSTGEIQFGISEVR